MGGVNQMDAPQPRIRTESMFEISTLSGGKMLALILFLE